MTQYLTLYCQTYFLDKEPSHVNEQTASSVNICFINIFVIYYYSAHNGTVFKTTSDAVSLLQQMVNKNTGSADQTLHSFILQIPDHVRDVITGCSSKNTLTVKSHTFTLMLRSLRLCSPGSQKSSVSRALSADEEAWPKHTRSNRV